MKKRNKPSPQKLLVIYGPTASGKTSLALSLAQDFDGELVSADSRQVYKGMDIITGKDLPLKAKKKKSKLKLNNKTLDYYLFNSIPVWGLDLVHPDEDFSAAHWLEYAQLVIKKVWQRGKLPIIVGGTAFWLKALLGRPASLGIVPDKKLRRQLQKKSVQELYDQLTKLDRKKTESLNQSDRKNPRRLIRAIEVAKSIQKKKSKLADIENHILANCDILKICLTADIENIEKLINKRVQERVKQGGLEEIKALRQKGYGFDLPSMTACGYLAFKDYFDHSKSLDTCIKDWYYTERSYAKRQKLWFAQDKDFVKINIKDKGWRKNLAQQVKNWYYN